METLLRLHLEQQLTNQQLANITEEQRMHLVAKTLRFLNKNKVTQAIKKDFEQLLKDFGDWLTINPGGEDLWEYYESTVRLPIW